MRDACHVTAGPPRLGVDFGRVINDASSHPSGNDTAFLGGTEADILATPAMEGAFDVLAHLSVVFAGSIWVISKCGPEVQARTERWLSHHKFFQTTEIDPSHIRFCRRRSDKAIHCQKLGITHFVDDRADVLQHLHGIVPHLFLFGLQRRPGPSYAVPVPSWVEAEREILASLGKATPA